MYMHVYIYIYIYIYIHTYTPYHSNVQQLGRTHRSNQVHAPEFKLLVTDVCGESRLISSVASRLQKLGALTMGDRKACRGASIFKEYSMEPKYALEALEKLGKMIVDPRLAPEEDRLFISSDALKNALRKAGLSAIISSAAPGGGRKTVGVHIFMNRLMGMKIQTQNEVFRIWMELVESGVNEARKCGKVNEGIVEMARDSVKVCRKTVLNTSRGEITHVQLQCDRGVSWDDAWNMLQECREASSVATDDKSGFYLSAPNFTECFLAVGQRQEVPGRKPRCVQCTTATIIRVMLFCVCLECCLAM
jgi:hypothetical protein